MPAATEKPKSTITYAEFIKSLQVRIITLRESHSQIDLDAYWGTEEKKEISYDLESKPLVVKKDHFDVDSTLSLAIGTGKTEAFVRLVATFYLHFHAASLSQEFVRKFCDSEIRLIVFPYFREYIMNATARMNIPPVLLPLRNPEEDK